MSCNQHREAYKNWQRKLPAVEQNQWQDQEMINELKEASKRARQALRERISYDRVYREALKRAHKKAISDQLRRDLEFLKRCTFTVGSITYKKEVTE